MQFTCKAQVGLEFQDIGKGTVSSSAKETEKNELLISKLEKELSDALATLNIVELDRQRLRARLVTTASQLESAVAEARDKDKDRRNSIKAYKQKLQHLNEVLPRLRLLRPWLTCARW